jgi:hypothetical protein
MSLASQGIMFGAFSPIYPGGDLLESVNEFEQRVGRRQDVVNSFKKWGAPSGIFPGNTRTSLRQASGGGRFPMVTWEPLTSKGDQGPYNLASIAAGEHDEYLTSWALGLRELASPVYLRPMHEMNGSWYPWSGDPEAYVAAWRHIVNLFRANGTYNAAWVWCVNASDQPRGNWLENYWPGSEYVDILGIDAYNCYSGWRPFSDLVASPYERVCALDPHLPVWICETASSEASSLIRGAAGQSKSAWISGMFATNGLERVQALLWQDDDNPASYDWRVMTSEDARRALATALYRAQGWVPPPGPYVPPVPDRLVAVPVGPGEVELSWRTVVSFTRGYKVQRDGGPVSLVAKQIPAPPRPATRIIGLTPGEHRFAVASFTRVRQSAYSVSVTCTVE